MIPRLDYSLGWLAIGKLTLKPNISLNYLNDMCQSDLDEWFEHEDWKQLRLKKYDNYIFVFHFFKLQLKKIEILKGNGIETREFLNFLGGSKKCFWGDIQLNDDVKAGYISILIKYNEVKS